MNEALFLSAVLLILIGAMGFYFYSRVTYTDKKINLLESILLDIKMNMDMESQLHIPPPLKEPEPFEPEDSEELKEEAAAAAAAYSSVIEAAATGVEETAEVEAVSTPDYDSMSREELNALAEKRSLRVTKSMKKVAVINLLRESDRNSSVQSDTGVNATLSTEGSGGGAPLSMEDSNELSAETLSS
jgi:hypothetical protein